MLARAAVYGRHALAVMAIVGAVEEFEITPPVCNSTDTTVMYELAPISDTEITRICRTTR